MKLVPGWTDAHMKDSGCSCINNFNTMARFFSKPKCLNIHLSLHTSSLIMAVFTDFFKTKKNYGWKPLGSLKRGTHTLMEIWSKSSANKLKYLKEIWEDLCNATESICTLFITSHTAAENFTPVNENNWSYQWRWLNSSDTNICSTLQTLNWSTRNMSLEQLLLMLLVCTKFHCNLSQKVEIVSSKMFSTQSKQPQTPAWPSSWEYKYYGRSIFIFLIYPLFSKLKFLILCKKIETRHKICLGHMDVMVSFCNLNKMYDYFQSPDFPTKSLKSRMIIKIKIK